MFDINKFVVLDDKAKLPKNTPIFIVAIVLVIIAIAIHSTNLGDKPNEISIENTNINENVLN